MPKLLLAFLLIVFAGAVQAREAGVVFPPGASVGLEPPPAMVAAKGFSGFMDAATNSSIVIAEMPAVAYEQIVAKMTPEVLAAQGMKVEGGSSDWPISGGQARIMRGSQVAQGTTYTKWLVIAGSPALTALVTVQVPASAKATIPDAAIETALRSITLRAPAGTEDQMAALPFTIGDLAGLRPVRTIMGSAVYLTDGPKDVVNDNSQGLVIVAASLGKVQTGGDRTAQAREALMQIKQVRDVKVADESRETDGAVEWVRHEGSGTDVSSGAPLGIIQVVRFEGPGYVRVIGLGRGGDETLTQRTRRLASSIRLK